MVRVRVRVRVRARVRDRVRVRVRVRVKVTIKLWPTPQHPIWKKPAKAAANLDPVAQAIP